MNFDTAGIIVAAIGLIPILILLFLLLTADRGKGNRGAPK